MSAEQPTTATAGNDESLRMLSAILFEQRRVRLFDYKDRWFRRRLLARLRSTQTGNIDQYLAYLKAHPGEIDRLLDALAINISSFFRNPDVFETIARAIFDSWAAGRRKIRYSAWSCACAQGEEPYSLAMLWAGWKTRTPEAATLQLRIIASDVDADALSTAEAGVFSGDKIQELPEQYRSCFEPNSAGFRVKSELRGMVAFVRENVLLAERPQKHDLILCRNFLIFLDPAKQQKMVRIFHDSLQPDGFLVLGRVEAIFHAQKEGFRAVDSANRIYRKV